MKQTIILIFKVVSIIFVLSGITCAIATMCIGSWVLTTAAVMFLLVWLLLAFFFFKDKCCEDIYQALEDFLNKKLK